MAGSAFIGTSGWIYDAWRDETPPQFRFAVKAHRYLTHNKKLKDPLGPIRLERDRAAGLGAHRIAVCQSDAADWPLWDAVIALVSRSR